MRRTRRFVSLLVLTTLLSLGVVPFAFASEVGVAEVVDGAIALDTAPLDEVEAPEGAQDVRTATAPDGDEARQRTEVLEAPIAFTTLWAELPDGTDAVAVRTSADGAEWTEWQDLVVADQLDAPDPGTEEAAAAADAPRITELLQLEEARYVQVEGAGDETAEVVLRLADTAGLNESLVARVARHLTPRPLPAEAATVPSWVNTRATWGAADYKGTPSVARNGVEQVVVHHTAGANNLVRADGSCDRNQVISTIRGIQRYHQTGQNWSDIGYNVVIDPCGGVWEARQGGLDRAVIGAHARGANTGSTGVSVLGNYTDLTPNPRILDALDRVVGWKAGIHGIDTTGTVTRTINGTTKAYPTVVGHRNVGQTSCPGTIMNSLDRIRANARAEARSWERVPDGLGVARFVDTTGNTHAAAIDALVERGITDGYPDGTFRPQRAINRAQVATFLAKALGLAPIPGQRFSDVDPAFVHSGAINALVEAEVLGGYDDGSFRPNEPLRREHMAAVLTRALDLELRPDAAAVFPDVIGYAGEIGAIFEAGITTGRADGTFQPGASVTRGQMATFLMNAVAVLEQPDPEPVPDPEPDPEPTPPPSD